MPITLATGSAAASTVATEAYDAGFIQRIQVLGAVVALEVLAESSATSNHAARVAYATTFLRNPPILAASIAWAVVADLVTGTTSTDQDLITRLEAVWNAVSGPGA